MAEKDGQVQRGGTGVVLQVNWSPVPLDQRAGSSMSSLRTRHVQCRVALGIGRKAVAPLDRFGIRLFRGCWLHQRYNRLHVVPTRRQVKRRVTILFQIKKK